jgi:signal transduction histidine kinase
MFALWCLGDLGSWFSFLGAGNTMFLWSLLDLVGLLMFYYAYYFLYTFVYNHDLPTWQRITAWLSVLPVILYTWLGLHLQIYDANSCAATENAILTKYPYVVEFLFIISSIIVLINSYRKATTISDKKRNLLTGTGVLIFLIFFYSATLVVSLLAESDTSLYVYNYEIYGLFGMPILLIYLGYLIVQFKAFNIKLAGAQALVFGLIAIIGSQLFFVETKVNTILVSITLFISILGGFFLVRSVKREIQQREELELLTQALEKANARLRELDKQKSEFVSIASHQLRSPLTAMRGYASMLAEGSFGKLPDKALEAAKRIDDSAKLMIMSVEDYLNVSRIESGNMKYNLSDFNVKEMAEKICDDLRPEAMKQNLILLFRTDINSRGVVNADVGKTNQIIHNLINNSIKYTPKGSINVFMRDDQKKKRIYIDITDTGIGMSQETMHTLFQKFSRADNANSVNVSGTGLGLYVAAKMAEQMGGQITCTSPGDGKGSTFTFELPLAM